MEGVAFEMGLDRWIEFLWMYLRVEVFLKKGSIQQIVTLRIVVPLMKIKEK